MTKNEMIQVMANSIGYWFEEYENINTLAELNEVAGYDVYEAMVEFFAEVEVDESDLEQEIDDYIQSVYERIETGTIDEYEE